MKRTILMTIAVASTIVVTAQVGALLYLSLTGVLTTESLWELQALFEDKSSLRGEEGPIDNGETEFSIEELMRERVVRTFDLEDREREMDRLVQIVVSRRDAILKEKQDLVARKSQFTKELEDLKAQETSEATVLAQGVLLAIPPADAVRDLMQLPLDHNIALLKGMPVKSIGKILKEFHQGDDQLQKRGAEIFESLAQGDPAVRMIEDEIKQIP
jgi:hypothetical protein